MHVPRAKRKGVSSGESADTGLFELKELLERQMADFSLGSSRHCRHDESWVWITRGSETLEEYTNRKDDELEGMNERLSNKLRCLRVGCGLSKHHISSGPSANRNSQAVPNSQGAAMPRATPGNRIRMAYGAYIQLLNCVKHKAPVRQVRDVCLNLSDQSEVQVTQWHHNGSIW